MYCDVKRWSQLEAMYDTIGLGGGSLYLDKYVVYWKFIMGVNMHVLFLSCLCCCMTMVALYGIAQIASCNVRRIVSASTIEEFGPGGGGSLYEQNSSAYRACPMSSAIIAPSSYTGECQLHSNRQVLIGISTMLLVVSRAMEIICIQHLCDNESLLGENLLDLLDLRYLLQKPEWGETCTLL